MGYFLDVFSSVFHIRTPNWIYSKFHTGYDGAGLNRVGCQGKPENQFFRYLTSSTEYKKSPKLHLKINF